MQKEKQSNCQDSADTSHQKSMIPTGSEEIWLEERQTLKGVAEFNTDLPGINKLSTFEPAEPPKRTNKNVADVRNNRKQRGSLF